MHEKHVKLAEKGTLISICIYTLIASLKLLIGHLFQSNAMSADGWNNFTDVLSSVVIFIGIFIAKQPADNEHQYGHWKIENIASLMSAFIMFFIGLQVLFSAISSLVNQQQLQPELSLIITGFIASTLMFITYFYNKTLATKIHSKSLLAVAKNNLSDALTSFITATSILLNYLLKLPVLDSIMALIVAIIILHTGFDIFKEHVFILSDGFNKEELHPIRETILSHQEIKAIRLLKARNYGSTIYVDVTVLMDPTLTVLQSHQVTEDIELELQQKFNVKYTDVHVEPYIAHSKNND